MSILTINAGSSSLRLGLFAQTENGLIQRTQVHHQEINPLDASHLAHFIDSINTAEITLVVHRVVHGGEALTTPCLIDAEVEKEIERLAPLAPLHNPSALSGIRLARHLLGESLPQVAVFDTAFYQALPQVAKTYALPQTLCQKYNIRRYGFHGIAHQAMVNRWQNIRPEHKKGGRAISLQLGSGCSITATDQGVPVDTSMGFSPLEGLMMATRSGDLDPALILYLQRQTQLSTEALAQVLNKKSGLLGVSGESADMRVLLASERPEARLAINLYCYRVRKYLGAYLAILGGADAVLFGGGVGENSVQVRTQILHGMAWLGIELDADANQATMAKEAKISTAKSRTEVWILPVDEAKMMVQEALKVCPNV